MFIISKNTGWAGTQGDELEKKAAEAEAKSPSRWSTTTPLRALTKLKINEGGHDYGAMVVL